MSRGQVYNILVHGKLLPILRRERAHLGRDLQGCLQFLQLGYWGQGVRVKALRGVRQPVYEARVNRAWRLLFTTRRAHAAKPPYEPGVFLLVWDLVDHDHIDRAKRMNTAPEAGFLDFEPLAELELAAPPVVPDLELDAVADVPALAAALRRAPAAGLAAELVEPIRWYEIDPDVVLDDAEWQKLLEQGAERELGLKLSQPQAEVVYAPGPVLLRGAAGSGKTTVCVYRLVRTACELPGARLLYVTYSEALRASARELYADLRQARRGPPLALEPEFLTFPELCRRLAGRRRDARPVLRFPAFEEWYTRVYRSADAALPWEEIRGILKGACLDPARGHLDLAQYEELGRKRAPLFASERPRLYRVFEQYQKWQWQLQQFDDIDLAREALALAPPSLYDAIVVDEGQDLTELEMQLLLRLVAQPGGLFFAADPQQIVNPSGFRWAELRSLLRQTFPRHPQPEILSLRRNYRSVASIVVLANALLAVQRERTGRSDDDETQETSLQGAVPLLVSGSETEVLAQLKGFGPRCAVVAASRSEAQRLAAALASERVFDIPGAKGLEFDACVLWDLFSRDLDTWREVLVGDRPLKEDPVARRALHHCYVAVTRARRYVGLFESRPEALALWQSPRLRGLLERDEASALAKFMLAAASPAEWAQEGEYFLARGRFRQAAECFRRANRPERAAEADARFHESVQAWAQAAPLYARLGMAEREAVCRENLGEFAAAGQLYRQLRRWPDAARNFSAAECWREAADACNSAGDVEGHARCTYEVCRAEGRWSEAARLALRLGRLAAASECYERAGNHERARELRNAQ